MECRITSPARRRAAAFSFVELIVAMSLSAVLALALASLSFYTSLRFTVTAETTDLSYKSRNALDTLTSELRQMVTVTNCTTNSVTVLDLAGNATSYSWSPQTRMLQRSKGGDVKVLLNDCESLAFMMCKASPIDGVLDVEPTTKTKECKALKVYWTCSRTNLPASTKTQVQVSETIVLRLQGL